MAVGRKIVVVGKFGDMADVNMKIFNPSINQWSLVHSLSFWLQVVLWPQDTVFICLEVRMKV